MSKAAGDNQARHFTFPAPLAGTPALGAGSLVLPLADGLLARVALKANPKDGVDRGLHWRAAHADAGALGHVVFRTELGCPLGAVPELDHATRRGRLVTPDRAVRPDAESECIQWRLNGHDSPVVRGVWR